MAIVSRLQLNHPTLGTAGGAGLHSSIESLYTKIGDNMADRWFAITDFDQTEVVDLLHNFETDINNLRYDLFNYTGGEWVRLTAATSPARSAFSVIEKVGSEATTLQITNNTGGNNLTFAVGLTFDSISLADSDIKDVDIVTTAPEDGQSLVWDSASSKFKPGASGDSSFKLQGVTDPNLTLKGGYLLLDDGREIATYDGTGTAATDFGTDIVVNLDTVLGSNPVDATTYYLYLNLSALGSEVTIDNGRKVYSIAAADTSKFYLSTTKPEAIKKTQYAVLGFIKSATSGTVWSGTGAAFGTVASKKFNQRKIESNNYLFDYYTAQSLGTVGNGNVTDTGNRATSTFNEWQSTNTTNISLSASTSSPLRAPVNFLFTGSGNNAAGTTFVESPAFQLNVADLGKPISVNFDIADVTADGNFDVCIVKYDSVGVYLDKISIAGNASGATPSSAKLPTGISKFNGFFIASSTSTDYYALRFRRLAGTDVPRLDSPKVSPEQVIQGAAPMEHFSWSSGAQNISTTAGATDNFANSGIVAISSNVIAISGPSSGTYTLTFNRTGKYKLNLNLYHEHANAYGSDFHFNRTYGGTATLSGIAQPLASSVAWGIDAIDSNVQFSENGIIDVTSVGQTITLNIQTVYNAVSGTTAQHRFYGAISIFGDNGTNVTMANRAVEEYASNSSTTDADDTTSFAYGSLGSQFGNFTAERAKRVKFQTPILSTDKISVEITTDGGLTWVDVGASASTVIAYTYQNTTSYGIGWAKYDQPTGIIVVYFGKYRDTTNTSFGTAGAPWSDVDVDNQFRWRVRKVSGGASVGFPISARNIVGDTSGIAVPSGYIGERKIATGSATNWANATYTDGGCAGLTLTPGVWIVKAHTTWVTTSDSTITRIGPLGVGTVSGNDSTGLDSTDYIATSPASHTPPGSNVVLSSAGLYVDISVSTTYYPKMVLTGTHGSGTLNNTITAIRIA